jgi:hypothetical protein
VVKEMGRSNVEKEIKKLLRITYCVKPDKKFILELVEKLKTMEDSIIMARGRDISISTNNKREL